MLLQKKIVKDIYEARASSEEDCELLVQKIFFKMNIVEGRASLGWVERRLLVQKVL